MKKITKFTLIRSLVVLGSCLALSQVSQAAPKFHGTLTISIRGPIMAGDMAMGGMDMGLGNDDMLMVMGTESVALSTGDFAVLGVRRGAAVMGPSMFMNGMLSMEMVMISSAPDWMWMNTGPDTFSSTGPGSLHITTKGMTMGGKYPMTEATLTGDFFTDVNGVVKGSLTLTAGSEDGDSQDSESSN